MSPMIPGIAEQCSGDNLPQVVMWHTDSVVLAIDGSRGEGGGQILRTSLALAAIGGKPIEIRNIRARRSKPGLARQHLACVQAAAALVDAKLEGAELRSKRLRFEPKTKPKAGDYEFDIGSAGSTGLVFQTVLWPLLLAEGTSHVTIRGGTHNPMAPSFDFLNTTFLPALRNCGASVRLELERYGFYPRGGGVIHATIEGGQALGAPTLLERGEAESVSASVLIAGLSRGIAEREADELAHCLDIDRSAVEIHELDFGPGNAVSVALAFENVTELVSGFGDRGVPGERIAREVAIEAAGYLASPAPVGEHLADQLVIPMALTGGGEIRCTTPSLHTRTNIEVASDFLPVRFSIDREQEPGGSYRIRASDSQG